MAALSVESAGFFRSIRSFYDLMCLTIRWSICPSTCRCTLPYYRPRKRCEQTVEGDVHCLHRAKLLAEVGCLLMSFSTYWRRLRPLSLVRRGPKTRITTNVNSAPPAFKPYSILETTALAVRVPHVATNIVNPIASTAVIPISVRFSLGRDCCAMALSNSKAPAATAIRLTWRMNSAPVPACRRARSSPPNVRFRIM